MYTKELMNLSQTLEDRDYLFLTISYHISPTIFEGKPSTLLTFNKSGRNLYLLWHKFGKEYASFLSVDFIEICKCDKKCTVIFYNKKKLQESLLKDRNMDFLRRYGYQEEWSVNEFLSRLKYRYRRECPHEIGIFLGFPLEDVEKFISDSGSPCLLCGYWKVYHNVEHARSTFKAYDEAKQRVLKNYRINGLLSLQHSLASL